MALKNKSLAQMSKAVAGVSLPKGRSALVRMGEDNASCHTSPTRAPKRPSQKWWLGPLPSVSVMTSDDRLSLILRRLDEIERRLDRMRDELRMMETPTAIGYSARRGNRARKD